MELTKAVPGPYYPEQFIFDMQQETAENVPALLISIDLVYYTLLK
jgi:hypothetical protein